MVDSNLAQDECLGWFVGDTQLNNEKLLFRCGLKYLKS